MTFRRAARKASEPERWTLEVYEHPDGSMPHVAFAESLDAYQRHVLDIAVRTFLARQGHNMCDTEWGKALGQGLYEFRICRTLRTITTQAGAELRAGINLDAVGGDQSPGGNRRQNDRQPGGQPGGRRHGGA